MAFETCSHCKTLILFGAAIVDGRPYCPGCWPQQQQRQKDLLGYNEAKASYAAALERVRASPTDPACREDALKVGRIYSAWSRHIAGHDASVTLFDEIALANDLQAASAGAATSSRPSAATPEERLEKLQRLVRQGLITEDEFTQKRNQILAEL